MTLALVVLGAALAASPALAANGQAAQLGPLKIQRTAGVMRNPQLVVAAAASTAAPRAASALPAESRTPARKAKLP